MAAAVSIGLLMDIGGVAQGNRVIVRISVEVIPLAEKATAPSLSWIRGRQPYPAGLLSSAGDGCGAVVATLPLSVPLPAAKGICDPLSSCLTDGKAHVRPISLPSGSNPTWRRIVAVSLNQVNLASIALPCPRMDLRWPFCPVVVTVSIQYNAKLTCKEASDP